jgi:hypothetical protein
MNDYMIRIEIPEGEVKKILNELTEAQQKIYECYDRLNDLGVVVLKKGTTNNTLNQ